MSEKVAFIGLGEMGLGMASNLINSGYQVFGFDTNQAACNEASKSGVIVCGSIREASASSDNAVISVVRDYDQTEKVIFGVNGIVSSGDNKLTIIIMSTLEPEALRKLAGKVEEAGYTLIDAPVSGAKARADSGELTIMTAGKKETVELCHPYFSAMGENIFYFVYHFGSIKILTFSLNTLLIHFYFLYTFYVFSIFYIYILPCVGYRPFWGATRYIHSYRIRIDYSILINCSKF